MKRIQLIAAALCLIMIATVGAGVVAAKQTENPRQAGASSIYFVDVKAADTHGLGKLMINVKEGKFVLNGKGFDPVKTYYLRYTVAGISGVHTFASVTATRSGTLHAEGIWATDLRSLPAAPVFIASTSPVVAVLSVSDAPPETGGHAYYLNATSSTSSAGDIVRYTLEEHIYRTNGIASAVTVYDGNNPHLTSTGQDYKLFIPSTGISWVSEWLTVYDSAGNSNDTNYVWLGPF